MGFDAASPAALNRAIARITEDLTPQVDEEFLDVFKPRVERAVGQSRDATHVAKRDGVDAFTQDQLDRRVANGSVIYQCPCTSSPGQLSCTFRSILR